MSRSTPQRPSDPSQALLVFLSVLSLSLTQCTTDPVVEDGDSSSDSDEDSASDEGQDDDDDDDDDGHNDDDDRSDDDGNKDGSEEDGNDDDASNDSPDAGDDDGQDDGSSDSADDSDDEGSDDGDDEGTNPPPDLEIPIVDIMEPSLNPPGGLAASEVPQFIVLGIDDNRYTDGMDWTLDLLEARTNPAGTGNARTYDGQPLITTFYFTTNALDDGGDDLLDQWKRAKADGHEVANHTHTHLDVAPGNWSTEIPQCNEILADVLAMKPGEILGMRAPFLDFSGNLYEVIESNGMIYDTSLTHIPIGGMGDDWQFYRHLWPYTLHKGTDGMSGQWSVGNHPGIWEVPVYTMPTVGPDRKQAVVAPMAGFDSTAYGTLKVSGPAFYNSMKWALDLRLEQGDNRAPLTIGLHSDTYSEQNDAYSQPLEERRKAIEDFIDYALTKPEVRFVSAKQMLQWMSDPVKL